MGPRCSKLASPATHWMSGLAQGFQKALIARDRQGRQRAETLGMWTPIPRWTLDKNWQTGWTVRLDGNIKMKVNWHFFAAGSGTQFADVLPEPNAGRLNQCSEILNLHMRSPGHLKQKTVIKSLSQKFPCKAVQGETPSRLFSDPTTPTQPKYWPNHEGSKQKGCAKTCFLRLWRWKLKGMC